MSKNRFLSRRKNLLIVSDLHLGEGLREATDGSIPRRDAGADGRDQYLERLEREFSAFLIHYTIERIQGRPWRLIINGDMVDFMSIILLPGIAPQMATPEELVAAARQGGLTGPEEVFGLGNGADQSTLKLQRVMERHQSMFRLLGRFVAAGNDLVIVVGNHDIEFIHRPVQQAFLRRLAQLGGDPQITRRVRFSPWFYYEENRIYVEHGHQYDEYCSFDYQLCPAVSTGNLMLSFSHMGMRFFANLVPAYDQRSAEKWGILEYLRWGFSLGAQTMVWLAYLYGLLAWKAAVVGSRLRHPLEEDARRGRHEAQRRALSRTYRMQEDKLRALEALRVPSVVRRIDKIFSGLFLDRVLLVALSVLLCGALLVLCPGKWKLAALAVVGAAVLGNLGLQRLRGVHSPLALRRVIGAIHTIVQAPLIVFGHSHEAERIPLPCGAEYINTGAWMEGGGTHIGTHLVVLAEGQRAELRKWRGGVLERLEL